MSIVTEFNSLQIGSISRLTDRSASNNALAIEALKCPRDVCLSRTYGPAVGNAIKWHFNSRIYAHVHVHIARSAMVVILFGKLDSFLSSKNWKKTHVFSSNFLKYFIQVTEYFTVR